MDSYTVRKIDGWTELLDSYRVWDTIWDQPICICDTSEDADRIARLLNADEKEVSRGN